MSFNFKSIDHFQLASPKNTEEIARKFFTNVLKFQEIDKPETLKSNGGVWFKSGSIQYILEPKIILFQQGKPIQL
ncbi:VOC family protein [Peribacillus butanolivorans]|uniref:hypothetical protein n=1 Tax=Peribacillus butanolivorans TaxID=421767 RepID=UPI0036600145